MPIKMQKLRILAGLLAVIYITLLVYYISVFGFLNFGTLGLLSGLSALGALLLYLIQNQIMYRETVHDLNTEKDRIKIHFDECNQTINAMFDHVSDGIALLNLQLDFFKINDNFSEMLGYTNEKILTWNLNEFLELEPLSPSTLGINQLRTGKTSSYQFKKKIIQKSGKNVWVYITITLIRDSGNKPHYFIMYMRNLTDQKNAEDHLSYLSQHDALLNIPNRQQFENFVNELVKSQNHQKKFCLLLLDLDNFKNVNTTIGYEAGNIVLQFIAKRLSELIRSTDLLARLTSDEFAIVLTQKISEDSIREFADKLLSEISQPIQIKHRQIYVTASVGISIYPNDGFTTRKLMKHADIALHHVKCHDKNNYQFYSTEMARQEKQKFRAKNDLAHALMTEQFYLQYQPRYKSDKQLSCLEVELCLQATEEDSMSLADMLTVTEDTGLYVPITDWVIATACKQLHEWRKTISPNLKLALTCEAKYIKHQQWVDKLLKVLEDNQLPPSCIVLQLTKLYQVQHQQLDRDSIYQSIHRLKQAGMTITLFMDGIYMFTALAKRLYIDDIKLNPFLTRRVLQDDTSAQFVLVLIAKAKEEGLSCVATGAENNEQANFLIEAGCAELQGDFASAAMTEVAASNFLRKYKTHAELPA